MRGINVQVFASMIVLVIAAAAPGGATALETHPKPEDNQLQAPGDDHLDTLLSARAAELPDPAALRAIDVQRSQLALVQDLDEALAADDTGLTAGQLVLDHRAGLPSELLPVDPAAFDHARSGLELVEQVTQSSTTDAHDGTLELLQAVTAHQARALGIQALHELEVTASTPSEAVERLLADHGIEVNEGHREAMHAYDGLPAPLAEDLAGLIEAFRSFEQTAQQARDTGALALGGSSPETSGFEAPDQQAAQVLSELLAARLSMVQAGLELGATLELTPMGTISAAPSLSVPPVLSIELDPAQHDTYTEDIALLIDGGGDDTYHNNAGGNGFDTLGDPCASVSLQAAAAGFDFGSGDDTYGDAENKRGCGANGGGYTAGAGFLYDAGGNDTYSASGFATNGGAGGQGFGTLIDEGGEDLYDGGSFSANGGARIGIGALIDRGHHNDTYLAGHGPANGGGGLAGSGLLLDEGGNESYNGTRGAVNGGSYSGFGTLVDLGTGDDGYNATDSGVNGGASSQVGNALDDHTAAFLYDAGGHDLYIGGIEGVNGGGENGVVGFLLDPDGHDRYVGDEEGVNGGGDFGVGFLLDLAGDDAYQASKEGVNGGVNTAGIGLLLDGAGNDTYEGTEEGVNGGSDIGVGFLYDRGDGDDVYLALEDGVNGGGMANGIGFLVDGGGDDHYEAEHTAVNGGGHGLGAGLLYDADGDDVYIATDQGTNGGGFSGFGLLYDGSGQDRYEAGSFGTNGGAISVLPLQRINRGLSSGLLYDGAGDGDLYLAGGCGVNGGAAQPSCAIALGEDLGHGLGKLVDDGGDGDIYKDDIVDCIDCSLIPKGTLGVQWDRQR